VPFSEIAGELVTIVPSLEGVGSVTRRAFWLKAKPAKSSGAIQEKRLTGSEFAQFQPTLVSLTRQCTRDG
jgi:hypothetical protein